jgi:o-succinylbenzoate synthase
VRLDSVSLVRLRLPLVSPFRTSFGEQTTRDLVLVHMVGEHDGARVEGWGENVAGEDPLYSYEFLEASTACTRDHLVPRLFAADDVSPYDVGRLLGPVRGWTMAKCSLEAAVLDAELRAGGTPLGRWLGAERSRVPVGVSVGLHAHIDDTVAAVTGYLADGYGRIKLKIEPGQDIEVVRAVREAIGPDVLLQVDANAAYTLADARHLARLDEFDLLLIEQPFAEDDLVQHAELARRLATPVCLDESITSAKVAADALRLGACSIINVKPGRVGGYIESRRIHDLCVANGVPAWVGGMLESGVGRAANLALAALPGFTLPPDLSASNRYYHDDVTEPFELVDGCLELPTGPGLGIAPSPERLERLGAVTETISRT